MQQAAYDWTPLVVGFLLWAALWVWLLWKRSSKLTLQMIFAITTGFAVISVLGSPGGQALIRRIRYANESHHWITLFILLSAWAVTTTVLRRMAREK